jgi:hypothetical protein
MSQSSPLLRLPIVVLVVLMLNLLILASPLVCLLLADVMFAFISTADHEQLGQIMVKQLKNIYNNSTIYKQFVLGIDRAKMRLYDCQ